LFNHLPYDRIGLSKWLCDGTSDGVAPAKDGYSIFRGRGLPRISIRRPSERYGFSKLGRVGGIRDRAVDGRRSSPLLPMSIFAFDIETVPDVESARRLYGLPDLGEREVAEIMYNKRRQETGESEFLRLHLHRVVAISVVLRSSDRVKVWSLGEPAAAEDELVRRFYDGIERFSPTLVTWNGSAFDLPVLHYRALLHGVNAQRYWEIGEAEQSFRWNNYLGRYHWRHVDLMDVLAAYQPRAGARLDEVATLLGFPGKMGMSGASVWERFLQGDIERIRNYCETDALNTYLIYLRFELMRGRMAAQQYREECQQLRESLAGQSKPHLEEFLAAWKDQ
jgi:predicted PolB exonuclease-like 3'-5' exonuclease